MNYEIAIEEMEDLIKEYENDISSGYVGDSALDSSAIEWRKKYIVNLACAIEVLKNNES